MHKREFRQLICAMLIGDGCLLAKGVYCMNHGSSQTDYALWKAELINQIFRDKNLPRRCTTHKTKKVDKIRNKTYYGTYVNFSWAKYLRHLTKHTHKIVKGKRRKNISYLLSQCTEDIHTAIMFMDDGTETKRKTKKETWTSVNGYLRPMYRLCTYSLTKGENQIFKEWFQRNYGVDPYISHEKFLYKEKDCERYYLRFSIDDTRKLFKIFEPYFSQTDSMKQKFWTSFAFYEDNNAASLVLGKDNIVQTTTPTKVAGESQSSK